MWDVDVAAYLTDLVASVDNGIGDMLLSASFCCRRCLFEVRVDVAGVERLVLNDSSSGVMLVLPVREIICFGVCLRLRLEVIPPESGCFRPDRISPTARFEAGVVFTIVRIEATDD